MIVKLEFHAISFQVYSVQKNDSVFPVLSNKNCDIASETPFFDMDDIINRLKKLNINKSPRPDMIHPRILYKTWMTT